MGTLDNLLGKTFGRLTVTGRWVNHGTRAAWMCRCACSVEVIVSGKNLRSGHTKSCGCLRAKLTAPATAKRRIDQNSASVVQRLKDRGIRLVSTYRGTTKVHAFECLLCSNQWSGVLNRYLYVHKCPKCSRNDNGFLTSQFLARNPHLSDAPAVFYQIKCTGSDETFYKVGITRQALKERFRKIPYSVEVISLESGTLKNIMGVERDKKHALRAVRYRPDKAFNGAAECFASLSSTIFKPQERGNHVQNR